MQYKSSAKTIMENIEEMLTPQEGYEVIRTLFHRDPPPVNPNDSFSSFLQKCIDTGVLNASEAHYVFFFVLTLREFNDEFPPLPSSLEATALKTKSDPLYSKLHNKDAAVVGTFRFNSKDIIFVAGANPYIVSAERANLTHQELEEVVGYIASPSLLKKAQNANVFVPYSQKKKRKSTSFVGKRLIPRKEDEQVLIKEGEKLFLNLLKVALSQGATDIHIRPLSEEEKEKEGFSPEEAVAVTYRVRMAVKPAVTLSEEEMRKLRAYFLSELRIEDKPLATADAAGSVYLDDGRKVRFRFSQMPTPEKFSDGYPQHSYAIRIHKSSYVLGIEMLGLPEEVKEALLDAVQKRAGIIIISGATGSGKSTTILSALKFLNEVTRGDRRILTLEDPVEVKVPGLLQTEINEEGGYSFAEGLRSALRHDPDVLFVGEVRDTESARLLLQAAITGHLVLTTLHAFAAEDIPGRLRSLGISPEMLINASLLYMEQVRIREFKPGTLKRTVVDGKVLLVEPESPREILNNARDRVLFSALKLDESLKEKLLTANVEEIRRLIKKHKRPSIKEQIIKLYREGKISTNTFNEFIPVEERKALELKIKETAQWQQ